MLLRFLLLLALLIAPTANFSQKKKTDDAKDKGPMSAATFEGLKFRSIGPALTSGCIVDIAVASGGVWKTVNAGTTFEPIFDSEASYSIGKVENACRSGCEES